MRVFKTRFFARFADKNNIEDADLCEAVGRAMAGLTDADLGGGVIKQRIARKGEGRSGGFRTIVLFRKADRAIFVDGYAKKDSANISREDLKDYRSLAGVMLAYSDAELTTAVGLGRLLEVNCNDEAKIS